MNSALLKLAICLSLFMLSVLNLNAQFSGGSGSPGDPYLISSAADFDNVRNYLGSTFLQTADIDLGVAPYNEGTGWIPLTENVDYPFTGTYEGAGHHIFNLTINAPDSPYRSLFGFGENCSVSNLKLEGVSIHASHSSGALFCVCKNAQISNISISGTIVGALHDTGGIVATARNFSQLSNCSTNMQVSGGHYSAGLVSYLVFSSVTDSYALGTVQGMDGCGGLVGDMSQSTLQNSFAISSINAGYVIGGLVGMMNSTSSVSNCFARCSISSVGLAGGISGTMSGDSSIINSYSASEFPAGESKGGLAGGTSFGDSSNSYYDADLAGEVSNSFGEARTTQEMVEPHSPNTYVDWDFAVTWQADPGHLNNSGYPYLAVNPVSNEEEYLPQPQLSLVCYPNPFNQSTSIAAKAPAGQRVEGAIYNLRGQLIKKLAPYQSSGTKQVFSWDGRDDSGRTVSSGVYFVRLISGGETMGKRVVLIR